MKAHLTERNVKTIEPDASGRNLLVFDDEVAGFGLRITPAGSRAFILNYRIAARKRSLTIGSWPDWSVSAARDRAKELKREIDTGNDPLEKRVAARQAPTVIDLIDRYLAGHVERLAKHTRDNQTCLLRKVVQPEWGARKVAEITSEDVDRLLSRIACGLCQKKAGFRKPRPAPISANRAGAAIRKMFNLAIRWKMRADNPAQGFAKNAETPRERYLNLDEIGRLSAVLADHPNQRTADAIRFALLTGARRGEILGARWDQLDLDAGLWIKPAATTKQRRLHRAPLSGAAVALLRTIRTRVPEDCPWVFPGDVEGQPLVEIKKSWAKIRTAARLSDIRMHDLRHTFASLLVSSGMTLPMIGRLLGHTQVQTTHRYAHLFDDPLRVGLNEIGEMLRPKLRLVEHAPQSDRAA
jgi:integrase